MFAVCLHRYARTSVRYFVCNLKMVRKGGGGAGEEFEIHGCGRWSASKKLFVFADGKSVRSRVTQFKTEKKIRSQWLEKESELDVYWITAGREGFPIRILFNKGGKLEKWERTKKKIKSRNVCRSLSLFCLCKMDALLVLSRWLLYGISSTLIVQRKVMK